MFSSWLRGPEDNSLEGRKKRLFEDREDFEALEALKARLDAKRAQQPKQDASPTVPSNVNLSQLPGATPKTQTKNYFKRAARERDQLEKTPKGIEPFYKVKPAKGWDPHPDEPVDEFTQARKAINSAGNYGLKAPNRPDMAGRSVSAERDEMATLEAIHAIANLGLEGDDLNDRVARHFQFKDQGGGVIGDSYTDEEKAFGIRSAIQSAQRMISHFNGQESDIALGSKGGQATDIPDDYRTNFFDDVYGVLLDDIEGTTGESGRVALLRELFGSDDGAGNFDDNIWPADVYITKKDAEEEMRRKFDLLHQAYVKDRGRGKISPAKYYSMFAQLVSEMHRDGNAVGYSLKKLAEDPDRTVDALSFNTNPDNPARILSAIINGKMKIPTEMKLDRNGNLKGSKGFSFDQLTKVAENDDEIDIRAKFDSKLAGKPNYYKVEPTPAPGDNARLGMVPTPILRQMIKEITGDEIGFNTNEVPGSEPRDILNSENFNEEQIAYWMDMVNDLRTNPSQSFDLNNSTFKWGNEEVEPGVFMRNLLESFNLSDEERDSDDDRVQRGEYGYDRVKQRMETMSMLKGYRMMQMFRNAERDGKLPDVLGRLIAASGKVNTQATDPFMAFTKIQSH